jgi:hypothetical protein
MARLQLSATVVATCIALIGAGRSAPAQQAVNPSFPALDANAQAQIAAQFPNVIYRPGQIIWTDQTNGPICAGPLGAGPCTAVWQWMASHQTQPPQPTVVERSSSSIINNPGQLWGGQNSLFHNPGQLSGGPQQPRLVEESPWGFCPPPCVQK